MSSATLADMGSTIWLLTSGAMRGGGFGELPPLPFYRSIENENVLVLSYEVCDETRSIRSG